MVQSKRQRYMFLAFCLAPTFIFFAVFTLYPLFNGLYLSFFEWSGAGGAPSFIGLENYLRLLRDPIIPQTIWHDYFFVITKVIGIMILATFFAVALTQLKIKESPFYRTVFFFPNIMSVVIIGILWTFIYNPSLGLINSGLEAIGLDSWTRPWLGSLDWALPSLVVPAIWAGIGLFMLLLIGGIGNIPKSIYEASKIDGADAWREFWKVTVPLVWPQLRTSILYIVITTLNGSFILVQVMTRGGPNNATHVMGSYLYQEAFLEFNFGYGAAIGVMILVLSLVTVVGLQAVLRRETFEY